MGTKSLQTLFVSQISPRLFRECEWLLSQQIVKAGGAFEFVVVCASGYLFVALMLESVEMPFRLPLGDLSNVFTKKTKIS